MIREAIQEITRLANSANHVGIVECPDLPHELLLRTGTEVERIPIPPPERKPAFAGFSDLVRALADTSIAGDPEVYVAESGIVAFLDRAKRTERATLALPYSARVLALLEIQKGVALTPKEAIRFLRLRLSGAHNDRLLPSLRKVEFSRKSTGQASESHGRESLGRSVEAMAQGVEDIPEEFRVQVQAFNLDGLRSIEIDVGIRIYLDAQAERIEFHPIADELTRALHDARSAVQEKLVVELLALSNRHVNVFCGTP